MRSQVGDKSGFRYPDGRLQFELRRPAHVTPVVESEHLAARMARRVVQGIGEVDPVTTVAQRRHGGNSGRARSCQRRARLAGFFIATPPCICAMGIRGPL